MPELKGGVEQLYRAQWEAAGRPLPLQVSRSRYDDSIVSWEVLWGETPNCDSPIAEFTTWDEALRWAIENAAANRVGAGDPS